MSVPSQLVDSAVGFAIRSGPNVFTTGEYAKAIGVKERAARYRLHELLGDKKVRRVRTRRYGTIVAAWEYVGK